MTMAGEFTSEMPSQKASSLTMRLWLSWQMVGNSRRAGYGDDPPEYRRYSAPHKALPVVPGVANQALVAARRFLSETAQAKLDEKFYEELPPEKRTRARGDLERQTD
jgi:hypothetical protein